VFAENKIIGLGFAVIDYDDVKARGNNGFWNLSRRHTMYGHASELCALKLMPLEPALLPALEARWSFKVVDLDRRRRHNLAPLESVGCAVEVKPAGVELPRGTTKPQRGEAATKVATGPF
jgi:hypothetical protein